MASISNEHLHCHMLACPWYHFDRNVALAGSLTLVPLIQRWVISYKHWNKSDCTWRSDNQDVVQLMRPVAAFTMLHCASPFRVPVCCCTARRSRFRYSPLNSFPTWQEHNDIYWWLVWAGISTELVRVLLGDLKCRNVRGQNRWTLSLLRDSEIKDNMSQSG